MAPDGMCLFNLCQRGSRGRIRAKWRAAFGLKDRTAGCKPAAIRRPFKIKHAPLAVLGRLNGTLTLAVFLVDQ